jgi:hypothetical protein
LNRIWRLAQCTLPEPDGTYCNEYHCPPCTWRATYYTPTGAEETRCINLRIWNDGTTEAPAYKARLTVEGSTFEKDLGATKPYILDSVGELTRTGGNEGAATVTAELEDGECSGGFGACGTCRCGVAPQYLLATFSGILPGILSPDCGNCSSLNQAFLLERCESCLPDWVEPGDCNWYYRFSEEFCPAISKIRWIGASLYNAGSGVDIFVRIFPDEPSPGEGYEFINITGISKLNCTTLDINVLAAIPQNKNGCDPNSATCHLEAP